MTDYEGLIDEGLDRLLTGVADDVDDAIAQLEEEGLLPPPLVDDVRHALGYRWRVASVGYVCPVDWCNCTATVDRGAQAAVEVDDPPVCTGADFRRHPETAMVVGQAARADVPDLRDPLR